MPCHSKIPSLPYTCYEVGHTWNPSCSVSAVHVLIAAALESMKIYGIVYMLSTLVYRKKLCSERAKRIFWNYVRSVCFLTTNAFGFISSFCLLRRLIGNINVLSASWFPAGIASYLAILVERPSRRSMLAIYVANIASECFFKVCVGRGYFKPIPRGEVILFVASMATFGYLFKTDSNMNTFIDSFLKFFIGKDEKRSSFLKDSTKDDYQQTEKRRIKYQYEHQLSILRFKHRLCKHQYSCLSSILISAAQGLGKGYATHTVLKLLTSMVKLFKSPSMLPEILLSGSALKMGFFFAAFATAFKTSCCLGRFFTDDDKPTFGALGGGFAGLAMFLYSSPTLALYSFWKALEALVEEGCKSNYLPVIPYGVEILYVVSTAYLFRVAIFEPFYMKSSYWRFLIRLSEGRISGINRILLNPYGLDSGRLQKWPQYDPKYLTENFKEEFKKELLNVL